MAAKIPVIVTTIIEIKFAYDAHAEIKEHRPELFDILAVGSSGNG